MTTFNENNHPRTNDGRFTEKPEVGAGIGLGGFSYMDDFEGQYLEDTNWFIAPNMPEPTPELHDEIRTFITENEGDLRTLMREGVEPNSIGEAFWAVKSMGVDVDAGRTFRNELFSGSPDVMAAMDRLDAAASR